MPNAWNRVAVSMGVLGVLLAACAAPTVSPSLTTLPPVATSGPSAPSAPPAVPTTVPQILPSPTAAVTAAPARAFDGARAYAHVLTQMAPGPRITGTPQNRAVGDMFLTELAAQGWTTKTQEFGYRGVRARNVWGVKGTGPDIVIIGAHYDTRKRADQDKVDPNAPVPGANDGASGAAVLLELARSLDLDRSGRQVWLVFFDAEDNGELDGWDWIVGSSQFAQSLTVTPTAVIVLDMIGDADQQIYYDGNSDRRLSQELWSLADRLGYGSAFHPSVRYNVVDDHTPFLARGIRAVDVIDFDYPYWHTRDDTADKVSPASLERVGRVVEAWLEAR